MTAPAAAATPLPAAFARQAQWCRGAGAPFTGRLLDRAAAWLGQAPDAQAVLAAVHPDPLAGATALRLAAALHHLALQGRPPWAALWAEGVAAGAGLDSGHLDGRLDAAIALAWCTEQRALAPALARAPQTHEVQRGAGLLPGLLHVAAATRRPLVLLELGASAGLNLWCDRWRYETATWHWGDPAAPLVLSPRWAGDAPATDAPLQVAGRRGCDLHPVDLQAEGEALRLASYVWAEQGERLARLARAVAAVRGEPASGSTLVAAGAADFLATELAATATGRTTVVMHSVVWQYLPPAEQAAARERIESAGSRARADSPLAWLRFEPPRPDAPMELRCRIWPGGEERLLARVHPHGAEVDWLGAPVTA